MLKLGHKSIPTIRFGAKEIKKAYLGTALVFGISDTPTPPDPVTYTVAVSIDPAGGGTASGAGSYQEGAAVTVTAAPADGYKFTGWQENGTMVSADETYTFTASRNVSLTAVFAVAPVSRLPEGYTEVVYIQSDGNCYIDTGVTPIPDAVSTNTTANSDTKIAVDVEFLDAPTSTAKYIIHSSGSIKTSSGGTSRYYFYIKWETTDGVIFFLGQTSKKPVTNTSLRRAALELDGINGICNADGVSAAFTSRLLAYNMDTIHLFGSTSTSYRIRAKMYSCQIYKGASLQLVRDFVPCINPSGSAGLYDMVTGEFYGSNGTGTFTPGPSV